ncbi:MAG: ArsA-related P-loop ATPase [Polyangiaceae bacterium]
MVTGKGGVGKSAVSAALSLAAARRGERVLAIELGAPSGLAGLLGVAPTEHGIPVDAGQGIALAFYDGEAALREYVLRRVPFKGAFDRLFEHPLYRAFIEAGPGIRELLAIGKVRDEVLGLATGEPAWDRIVLDAGASGDALELLGMPSAAARTFHSGLVHREATRVARWLADGQACEVHVVALPEEMPLKEARDILAWLRDLQLPLGSLIVNRCRRSAPPGASAAVAALRTNDGASQALAATAKRALGWLALQEAGIARLETESGRAVARLPTLPSVTFGWPEVAALADALGEMA